MFRYLISLYKFNVNKKHFVLFFIVMMFIQKNHAALKIDQLPIELQKKVTNQFPQLQDKEISLKLIDDVVHYLHIIDDFEGINVSEDAEGNFELSFKLTLHLTKTYWLNLVKK